MWNGNSRQRHEGKPSITWWPTDASSWCSKRWKNGEDHAGIGQILYTVTGENDDRKQRRQSVLRSICVGLFCSAECHCGIPTRLNSIEYIVWRYAHILPRPAPDQTTVTWTLENLTWPQSQITLTSRLFIPWLVLCWSIWTLLQMVLIK